MEHNKLIFSKVPTLRFPEFTDEWKKYRCSDLLSFFSTNSFSWDMLDYEATGMLNLHYGLIHSGAPTLIDVSKYALPKIKKNIEIRNYELCQDGDIAFADASEDTAETCKSVEITKCNNQKIVCGLHTIHARDKKGITIVGFKGYAFSSLNFHKQVHRLAQGTKIYSVSVRNFSEMHISIPSTDEQTKIKSLLWSLDRRIEVQNKIIEDLKILKKEICNRHFKQTQDDISLKYVSLQSILSERKEYCGKDGTYTHGTLSKDGVAPKTERYDRDFLVKNEDKLYKVTHFNDICYNPANLKFGVICRNTYGDLIFSPIYVTFEISDKVYPAYMELFLTNANFISRIRRYEQGTVYERMAVSPEDFLSYEVRMPKYKEQIIFADKIQLIQDKIELKAKILNNLHVQRKHLLNAMFI